MTTTRVLLACEPPLLQDVLASILEAQLDIQLVSPSSPCADIVLVSALEPSAGWPEVLPVAAAKARRIIALDAARNLLQVREQYHGRVTEQQVDGHIAAVLGLLRETPSGPGYHAADSA